MTQALRHEQNRAEILKAAARVIARQGFHGMSMRKLAQVTRRGLATFYNYFASKEEVLFELQQRAFATLIETAQESLEEIDQPERRLHVFISNHVDYFAANQDVMQVLVHEAATLPRGWRQVVRGLKEQYFRIGRDIVEAIMNPDDAANESEIERVTYMLFGMLNWVYGWYDVSRHGDSKDVAGTIHRMALHGLLGRGL
jgi:AcrR family transcriptional regulator